MSRVLSPVVLLVAAALGSAPAVAQSCGNGSTATLWTGTTGSAGFLFDIAPVGDMTVECLDLNTNMSIGTFLWVEVWWCPVTSVGNETNPGAWTLISGASGPVAGAGNPTRVDLSGNGVVFAAGQTYGIYVDYSNMHGVGLGELLGSTGGPNTWPGDHCAVTTRSGNLGQFGVPIAGLEWNGELHSMATGPVGPTLQLVGSCGTPGSGVVALQMSPNAAVGFAASPAAGNQLVTAGACGIVTIGLAVPVTVVGIVIADAGGTATMTSPGGIPVQACGWTMQALDVATCATTNTVML